jgi:hypothetical protein
MRAKLVECSDYSTVYGILEVKNVSVEEVQNKIYEIKSRFDEEEFDDWAIDDVLEEFPEEWDWSYEEEEELETIDI